MVAGPPRELLARRSDSLYGVHPYHTKVPPSVIETCIKEHTRPGDLVLDPFCGSGMTGVAAARTGRRAALNDLSPAAVHIARNYTTPCDPHEFRAAVERVLGATGDRVAAMYATRHAGRPAVVEYLVWSDVRACPACAEQIVLWDRREDGLRRIACPACGESFAKASMPLVGERAVEANLSGAGAKRIARPAEPADLGTERLPPELPWHPTESFGPERPMWRRGHADLGIRTVADFYSRRNLAALALLWEAAGQERDERLREALRFSLTAIANRASRRYQWNAKRPTNVLGGTLYVSSLRYEWNVLSLWRRKTAAVERFYASGAVAGGAVEVVRGSATDLALADASIDYCFTDPPFGANIVYSDSSLLWEAWLDDLTERAEEAIVVKGGDSPKTIAAYGDLLAGSFKEVKRVLKPGATATVVFQATDPEVWAVVQRAAAGAGLTLTDAATLDKGQPSFKQVKGRLNGERVAALDVVLDFSTRDGAPVRPVRSAEDAVDAAYDDAAGRQRPRTAERLYAGVVARLLRDGQEVPSFDRIAELVGRRADAEQAGFGDLYPDVGKPPSISGGGTAPDRMPLTIAARGTKGTPAYLVHSYPTKVPPEAIQPYVEHYSSPGDLVLDPFCGSGMTGLAARNSGRRAVLNDLSYGAAHLSSNLVRPCDPERLAQAAQAVLERCREDHDRLYAVRGRDGSPAHLHWTLFSQTLACPHCARPSTVWDDGTDQERGAVAAEWPCKGCGRTIARRGAKALGSVPAVVSLTDEWGRYERAVTPADELSLRQAADAALTDWAPSVALGPDREMYIRSALHLQGIGNVRDFWTPRNLRALARLWREILAWPDARVRQALTLAFTNTAWHGTRMRRYNAAGGQRPLTGTLYIPQLSIEVNVRDVFENKIRQLRRFFATVPEDAPPASVLRGSATSLPLEDCSIDYCFTDPPFGSNIFYADCALVWESWLGTVTPRDEEAVVNRSLRPDAGGKTVDDYADLMGGAFKEIERVLKPNAWTTVVFQSTDPEVWSALRAAVEDAGFDLANASYLDKTQQSHKGYKGRSGAEDVSSFDVVLDLHKAGSRRIGPKPPGGFEEAGAVIERHLMGLPPVGEDPERDRQRTLPFLHSLLVQAHFNGSIGLEIGEYALVRRICEDRFKPDAEGRWTLEDDAVEA